MEIQDIQHLLAILRTGEERCTVIVRPLTILRPDLDRVDPLDAPLDLGPSKDAGTWFASLTITPGELPHCEVFSPAGEPRFVGREAFQFLDSVGRLRWQFAPESRPKVGNGHRELLPVPASERLPTTGSHPRASPSEVSAHPPNDEQIPRRTTWGHRWVTEKPEALDRDHRKLLFLIDGSRTPAKLAEMLWPHLEEAGLAKVFNLLEDLRRAGFIT
jgi:hypothetical protein